MGCVVQRCPAVRVAGVNLRPVLKDDVEVRFVPEGRSSVQRRLAILVVRPDVGASSKQEFRDGRVLPRQYRLEERRPPVPVAGVGVRTARKPGGDAARVVGHDCFQKFPLGVDDQLELRCLIQRDLAGLATHERKPTSERLLVDVLLLVVVHRIRFR